MTPIVLVLHHKERKLVGLFNAVHMNLLYKSNIKHPWLDDMTILQPDLSEKHRRVDKTIQRFQKSLWTLIVCSNMKFCHLKTQSVSLSRETSEIQSEWLICSWQSVTEPLRAMPNNQNLCNRKEISDEITTGWHVKQQSCHTQYKHNISFITQMEHACSSNTTDKSQEGTLASEHAWEIQTDTAAASALIQCVCVCVCTEGGFDMFLWIRVTHCVCLLC